MKILLIKTDQPEAEIYLYDNHANLSETIWTANRKLAETISSNISRLLNDSSLEPGQLGGIGIYKGPGSFTGLRIGHSVANAMAYGLDIPIVACSGPDWHKQAIKRLLNGENDKLGVPMYGAPARVTKPRK